MELATQKQNNADIQILLTKAKEENDRWAKVDIEWRDQ